MMPAFPPRRRGPRGRFLWFGLVALAAVLALGGLVAGLWNAILPAALHAGPLSYWQGVGLLVLCRVLFGSLGTGRGGRGWGGPRGPHFAKWQRLSPDERQQFRRQWQARRFGPGPVDAGPEEGR